MKAFARAFGQAQAATPEKKKGGNGGTIALIIVGCVLIIGLAVAAFILFGQMSGKRRLLTMTRQKLRQRLLQRVQQKRQKKAQNTISCFQKDDMMK